VVPRSRHRLHDHQMSCRYPGPLVHHHSFIAARQPDLHIHCVNSTSAPHAPLSWPYIPSRSVTNTVGCNEKR
jgi:hypothetical protein